MYTERVARSRALEPRHSVENQWDLLTPLGIGPPDPARDPTEMALDPAAAAVVDSRLADAGLHGGQRLIVLHVGAGNPFRRWPAESFVDLAARLAGHASRRIVITSGPSDAGAARAIGERARARLPDAARERVLLVGDVDLAELRALIGRAALFIGGDSGPLHVAATTRTPVVGLYGPTLAARSAPWRDPALVTESVELAGLACRPCDQRRCVTGDFRCLGGLGVDTVWTAAERALERSQGQQAPR